MPKMAAMQKFRAKQKQICWIRIHEKSLAFHDYYSARVAAVNSFKMIEPEW